MRIWSLVTQGTSSLPTKSKFRTLVHSDFWKIQSLFTPDFAQSPEFWIYTISCHDSIYNMIQIHFLLVTQGTSSSPLFLFSFCNLIYSLHFHSYSYCQNSEQILVIFVLLVLVVIFVHFANWFFNFIHNSLL